MENHSNALKEFASAHKYVSVIVLGSNNMSVFGSAVS